MHFLANQADTEVPSLSVTDQLVGINNAQPSYALDVDGSLGFSIEDEGDVSGNATLSAACTIWKLNPLNAPPDIAYLPAPSSNEGRVLRVLNVNSAKSITLKTIGDGNFGGTSGGNVTLSAKKHVTLLCDGTSWYLGQ